MTRIRSLLPLAAAIALCCCGCQTATPGYRGLRDRGITLHEPTGLAFPSEAGQFYRSFAQQKRDDPKSFKVGYEHRSHGSPHMRSHMYRSSPRIIIITVEPCNGSPSDTLRSKKQSFKAAHPDAVITESPTSSLPALVRDWQAIVFDYHGSVGAFPFRKRDQPQRLLYAARTYGGYALFLESGPINPDFETVFFPAVDKFVGDLFPDRQ